MRAQRGVWTLMLSRSQRVSDSFATRVTRRELRVSAGMTVTACMAMSCKWNGIVSNARGIEPLSAKWQRPLDLPILVLEGDFLRVRRDLDNAHLLEDVEIVGYPHILQVPA